MGKAAAKDPPNGQHVQHRSKRNQGQDQGTGDICEEQNLLAIMAVHPGPNDQTKEGVRKEFKGRCDAQTHRRTGEVVNQEGQGEESEGATEVRNGLSRPKPPEGDAGST